MWIQDTLLPACSVSAASCEVGCLSDLRALEGPTDLRGGAVSCPEATVLLKETDCLPCDKQGHTSKRLASKSSNRQSKHLVLLEKELQDWISLIHWFYLLNVAVTLIASSQM